MNKGRKNVSPHSNNAYKLTAPLVKIDISIKRDDFPCQNKN